MLSWRRCGNGEPFMSGKAYLGIEHFVVEEYTLPISQKPWFWNIFDHRQYQNCQKSIASYTKLSQLIKYSLNIGYVIVIQMLCIPFSRICNSNSIVMPTFQLRLLVAMLKVTSVYLTSSMIVCCIRLVQRQTTMYTGVPRPTTMTWMGNGQNAFVSSLFCIIFL